MPGANIFALLSHKIILNQNFKVKSAVLVKLGYLSGVRG